MTEELAALLDGPVAERFGRPTDAADFAMYWDGDGTGERWWVWNDPAVGDIPSDPIPDTTAAALWLAHLIGACVPLGLAVEFHIGFGDNREVHITSLTDCMLGCHGDGTTILEALASAMMLVPVKGQP